MYDIYREKLLNDEPSEPPRCRARFNDFDEIMDEELGLDSSNNNDFDQYINQARENIRDENGDPQLLTWWKNRTEQFPYLSRVVRDVLAMQASSVASEQAFSAGRFFIGDHRYSLAKDSLEISVLFRDWINAERRNAGLPNLSHQAEVEIDEALGDNSDDGMEAMDEENQIPIPDHVSKELIDKLRKAYFQNYRY